MSSYNLAMRVLEAKDFLVEQTSEQAAIKNVPLSDLEKGMMYFTETDEAYMMLAACVALIIVGLFFQRQVTSPSDWFFSNSSFPF